MVYGVSTHSCVQDRPRHIPWLQCSPTSWQLSSDCQGYLLGSSSQATPQWVVLHVPNDTTLLSFLCIYIYVSGCWFVLLWGSYITTYIIDMIILSWFSLKSEHILKTPHFYHFYSPLFMFNVFEIIFSIFLFCVSLNCLLWI